MKKLLLVVLALLLCATLVIAQEPIYDYFVYLPMVTGGVGTTTPTMTPTPTPGTVHILPNYSHYVTEYGDLFIIGEVQNDTSSPVQNVRVMVNFFDDAGQPLGGITTSTPLRVLLPRDKTCFILWLSGGPTDWAHYEFEIPTYSEGNDPHLNLTIFGHSGSYISRYGWYEILGQVRNDGSTFVEDVGLIGTLYNAAGTVIDGDCTYTSDTDLHPGQVMYFRILFTSRTDYIDVASYRLQADGWHW